MEDADIKIIKAQDMSGGASSGGPMGSDELVSAVVENLFPKITKANRAAGRDLYRKVFFAAKDSTNTGGDATQLMLYGPTVGGDAVYNTPGTQDDVQSDITGGTPDWYGTGSLDASVLAGNYSIDVLVEDPTVIIYRNGGTIFISDDSTFGAEDGNTEEHVINGTPSIDGSVVTITLTDPLANGFSNTNTIVSSTWDGGEMRASYDSGSVTNSSAAGTFDDTSLEFNNIGAIYHTVTLTFTTTTTYDAVSSVDGALGSGAVGSAFAPVNPAVSAAYFTIPSAVWGGTFVAGDIVTVLFYPSGVPEWIWHHVPSSIAAAGGNQAVIGAFVDAI